MLIFAYKIMVTTLIIAFITALGIATYKAKNPSGQKVSILIIVLYAMAVVAIWG